MNTDEKEFLGELVVLENVKNVHLKCAIEEIYHFLDGELPKDCSKYDFDYHSEWSTKWSGQYSEYQRW